MIVESGAYTFRSGPVDGWMDKCEREGVPIQAKPVWRSFTGEAFAPGAVPTPMILNPARLSPVSVMERA